MITPAVAAPKSSMETPRRYCCHGVFISNISGLNHAIKPARFQREPAASLVNAAVPQKNGHR